MLNVKSLTMRFGGLVAVHEMDISVEKDEIIGLIGPNGAGKTTLFNCITGVYQPTQGHVSLDIQGYSYNIGKAKAHEIINWGMARTFQNVRLFSNMTVLENVLIGYHSKLSSTIMQTIFRRKDFLREEKRAVAKAYEILEYFDLHRLATTPVKELPFGRQKVLEVARALMSEPKILLLDEPAAGLNTNETHDLMELIEKIQKEFSLSVLLIEHDMKFVMNLCQKVYVMDHGELIAKDIPDNIQSNPLVITAYLGEQTHE